jgi:nicotinate-nucleotide adenylyltransferase
MKIGILGGSFDPPHFGHLLVARQTLEIMNLDEVWLMPYFAHNWDSTVSPATDRLAMANLIVEPKIKVSDEEINFNQKSYTIDTIRRLKNKYSHDFYWIVGTDILAEFNRWKDPDDLQKEVKFLVFQRNGYQMPQLLPSAFEKVVSPDLVSSNISSTIVRNRLVKGLSVVGLIPEAVLVYIKKHHLYEKH